MPILDLERRLTLLTEAAALPRLRTHELWHTDHSDGVQRLVLAAHPGSYIAPHSHAEQWEVLTQLHGHIELLIFCDDGVLQRRQTLQTGDVIELPAGTYHTLLIKEPACLFEAKPGPFRPSCFAPWAPQENTPEVCEFQDWLVTADIGSRYPG